LKEATMLRVRLFSLRLPLLFVACLISNCGGGNNRRLQSISITGVANAGQVSFVATGTYNTSPITVTPLATSWYVGDPSGGYALTTEPFVVACNVPNPTVTAMAPADPQAPGSGSVSNTKMVVANAAILCP
ncbi:MAG: hypothetical protein WAN38_15875, partial [Terriglobales bacterium]